MQKLYSETSISNIADAIRAKGGTGTFTVGEMAQAIEDLPSGGGYTVNDYLSHNFAGAIEYTPSSLSGVTLAKQTGITSISLPNVTSLSSVVSSCFSNMTGLLTFSAPKATNTQGSLLSGCTALTSVDLSALTDTNTNLLSGCVSLTTVVLKAVKNIYSQTFRNCTNLTTIDVLASNGFTNQNNMNGCTKLTKLIIRKSNGVASLANINNFTSSPFASNGTGGTLYVPSALISSYQSATNWSTILGYANNSIQAIEGSQYENYYADGTPIS